jgi:hypothetical protein
VSGGDYTSLLMWRNAFSQNRYCLTSLISLWYHIIQFNNTIVGVGGSRICKQERSTQNIRQNRSTFVRNLIRDLQSPLIIFSVSTKKNNTVNSGLP